VVPLVLGLLAAAAVGLWWALVPHVLSALALGAAASGRRQEADRTTGRLRALALGVGAATLAVVLANDLATFRGTAFLPRWE
jgi:hypothetical protein